MINVRKDHHDTHHLKNLVLFDIPTDEQKKSAEEVGYTVYQFRDVIEVGKEAKHIVLSDPEPESVYMFAYTSGTTGEPKAAILRHS